MAILSWPSGVRNPSSISGPTLRANTMSGGVSPFDGTEQTLALPGSRWVAELRWNRLPVAEWRILTGFIAALGGRAGRFTWGPGGFAPRRGTAPSGGGIGPRVRAASSGGVLKTTGWGAGVAFEAGDFFGWLGPTGRPQLAMATATVTASGGNCDVPVAPIIRRVPNADQALVLVNPVAVWRLAADEVPPEMSQSGGPVAAITLQIEEALW